MVFIVVARVRDDMILEKIGEDISHSTGAELLQRNTLVPEESVEVLGGPKGMTMFLISLHAEALGGVLKGLG